MVLSQSYSGCKERVIFSVVYVAFFSKEINQFYFFLFSGVAFVFKLLTGIWQDRIVITIYGCISGFFCVCSYLTLFP